MDVAAPTHTRMVHTHPGQPIAPGIYAWAMRSPPGRLLAATATRSFSLPSLSTPTPPLPAAKHPESFRLFLTLTPTGAKMVTTMTRTKATACPAPPALAPPAPGAAWTPPPATPVCPPASAAWRATSLMTPPASASVPPLELPRLLFWVRGGGAPKACKELPWPCTPCSSQSPGPHSSRKHSVHHEYIHAPVQHICPCIPWPACRRHVLRRDAPTPRLLPNYVIIRCSPGEAICCPLLLLCKIRRIRT